MTDREEFFYSHLLLHKPWINESELKGNSSSYEEEYHNLITDIPALTDSVEKALNRRRMKDQCDKKVSEALLRESQNIDADDSTKEDVFEVIRKQTDIENQKQLDLAVSSLSPDQLRVYQQFVKNVEHYYLHKVTPQKCDCDSFVPLHIFVSGFGGSGKSYLIRTLMGFQYVKSEINMEPCHFLLGAPTGIASCNISGQTLHSIWQLPVEKCHTSEYKPLSVDSKNKLRASYNNVCGHIIDEVSMISNQMLMHLNMRMMEVFGSTEVFGGMPLMVLGDLLQLEPVNGAPAYIPMTPGQINRFTGGLPCGPDLWKVFSYDELTTNHRQKGDANDKWRDVLSRVRFGLLNTNDVEYLSKRIIDTSDCKGNDYIDIFITKFIECENICQHPVCLLPKRSMCEEFNKAVMIRKGQIPVRVQAQDKIFCTKGNHARVLKKIKDMDERETGGLADSIDIAINTRVMLRVNDKNTPGLVNGARGTVTKFDMDKKSNAVSRIFVKFDNIEESQCIERREKYIQVMSGCHVYRRMFPLINSYAMTIHKSQSLTLPCVFIDLGSEVFLQWYELCCSFKVPII